MTVKQLQRSHFEELAKQFVGARVFRCRARQRLCLMVNSTVTYAPLAVWKDSHWTCTITTLLRCTGRIGVSFQDVDCAQSNESFWPQQHRRERR